MCSLRQCNRAWNGFRLSEHVHYLLSKKSSRRYYEISLDRLMQMMMMQTKLTSPDPRDLSTVMFGIRYWRKCMLGNVHHPGGFTAGPGIISCVLAFHA